MFKKIILSLLVIYTIVGFVILPIVLKSKIVEIANSEMNAKLNIEDIDFNPFIFKLGIYGLELKDLDGKHLVSFKAFELDFEPHSLYDGTINIQKLLLDKPQISLVYLKDKSFNLASILKPKPEVEVEQSTEESQIPRILLGSVVVKNGGINYKDFTKTKEYKFSLRRLSFKLNDIDTNEFDKSGASLKFFTKFTGGGRLEIKSKIIGFKPFKLEGSVNLELQKLYDTWKYVQDDMKIEVANGSLALTANYFVNIDNLNDTLIDNIKLTLNNLRVKPKFQNHDVLNLKSFEIRDVSVRPFQKNIHVPSVVLESLHVELTKDKNGDIDWIKWFENEAKEKLVKVEDEIKKELNTSKPWKVLVDSVILHKISVGFDDESVSPSVKTELNDLNINLKHITLAGVEPLIYDIDLKLNDKFTCKINGDVKHKNLDLNTVLSCKGFDITHYNPYITKAASKELKENDVVLKRASLDMDIIANITNEQITLKHANITLNKLKINKASLKKRFVTLNKLQVKSSDLIVNIKSIDTDVTLNKLNITLEKLAFYDYSISKVQTHKIDKISINASNINSKKNTWLNYDTTIKLRTGGLISSKGKLQHTPLKHKGDFKIKKLSLKEITPYLQETMYTDLKDGYISLNSKVEYAKDDKKADLHVEGSFDLESFELADSRSDTKLLSISNAKLKTFDLKLFPSSIYIDEIVLDSFYVDAVIDENKVMNFAKLAKAKDENITKSEEVKTEPFNYKIMRINVKNGTGNFADYSLPIRFKTSMHSLNGDIYAISNSLDEITFIDINGEVDEYGSTKIKGSLKSANFKSFTDIAVSFKNLNLNAYSGYSAQFAGHKINKGKLFLSLEYKIKDSLLLGKNNLLIKHIELGDEIDDENITTLPLGFAIALLEDSDGIIEIDMPVEGNLDAPDFKYGALILKTFVNLIVKAVTSPFRFLGVALGIDGENLEFADFEAGAYVILAPEREKMDNIAKILDKKPKLSFKITATYDSKLDKLAMQKAKVKAKILALNSKKEEASLVTIEAVEKIYEKAKGEDILDKLKDDLQIKFPDEKVYEDEYKKELFARTINLEVITQEELKELATNRANALKTYLLDIKGINPARVLVAEVQETQEKDEKLVKILLNIVVK